MKTKDVWVVYDNSHSRILDVFGFEFEADKKEQWYHTDNNAPKVHYKKTNAEVVESMTLYDAVEKISQSFYQYGNCNT